MNIPNNKRKKDSQDRIEKSFLKQVQTKELNEIRITDICKDAKINRTTFYANYIDIYDLADKVRDRMILEYAQIYQGDTEGHTRDNYIKMFKHIKENQTFYKTYFKLNYDNYPIDNLYYDKELAKKYCVDDKMVPYHMEFFKAGITSIIKKWLKSGCKETPEEMADVIVNEYTKKIGA